MTLATLGKVFMATGGLLFIVGVALVLGARVGLGSLPGDLSWRRGNVSVYIPVATSIILSIVLTIVLNLLLRWRR
jgi:Protein of unknown function (DUF2905)